MVKIIIINLLTFSLTALSCGSPEEISHGWHSGDCYTLGCEISYHCMTGFELVGPSEILCQANGIWSSEPPSCTCKKKNFNYNYVEKSIDELKSEELFDWLLAICDVIIFFPSLFFK